MGDPFEMYLEKFPTTYEGELSRDEFAARAMQGLLAITSQGGWTGTNGELARQSYDIADAMINARRTDLRNSEARQ